MGLILTIIATAVTIYVWEIPENSPERSDAPADRGIGYERGKAVVGGVTGGAEVRKRDAEGLATTSQSSEEGKADASVPTGTSTVPSFPRTLTLPTTQSTTSPALPSGTGSSNEAYTLLGLGIRTVSFLGIQVYVVGLYVANSDVHTLQERLIKYAADTPSSATTLVSTEKETLKNMLVDAESSERVWDDVLRDGGIRSVLRIVPTRNTDMGHLRDGWVRGITARSQARTRATATTKPAGIPADGAIMEKVESYDDDSFGASVGEFKTLFSGAGRKGVGKGKILMLDRDAKGILSAWVESEGGEPKDLKEPMDSMKGKSSEDNQQPDFICLGQVSDERISRLVWLGYLAGKNVASEGARKSVIAGVMELVERPVGTVETMVL